MNHKRELSKSISNYSYHSYFLHNVVKTNYDFSPTVNDTITDQLYLRRHSGHKA